MNIAPDLNTKKQIIENAVEVARSMEIEELKVACICAKEKVNPKMIDTVEAKELEEMFKYFKSDTFFAQGETAGIVMGVKAPVILTSRSDSDISKLNSIELGVLVTSK